jgi:hypothetical protein
MSLSMIPAVVVVAMPENWGFADYAGFFVLAVAALAVAVRFKVLRAKPL